jgi:hypothetical protein
MQSVSPVWTDNEVEFEKVVALDQPEYFPVVVLPIRYGDGNGPMGLAVRFRLTDDERKQVADGGDIIITQLSSGQLTPVNIQIRQPGETCG